MKKIFNMILLSSLLLIPTYKEVTLVENQNIKFIKDSRINSDKKIKNVILFIGDGMGPNHVDAGNIFKGSPLTFDKVDEKWSYHAYVNTDSLSSEAFKLDTSKSLIRPDLNQTLYKGSTNGITCYTDSAAAGSSLATGKKYTNSSISLDIEGNEVETTLEIAKKLNKKAGVISSDQITGATPSTFYAHCPTRNDYKEILEDCARSKADLVLCKNKSTFKNNKEYYENLYKENGFDKVIYNKNDLDSSSSRLLGLFDKITTKDNDYRVPSLKELTGFALDFLDNENGFFLMVEGAYIDKQSHAHQGGMMLDELIAFDNAISLCESWCKGRDDTLIIVTADHETGGLYFDSSKANKDNIDTQIKWLTGGHSRTRVDLSVYGDISSFIECYSSNFSTLEGLPYWDNTDVFKLCASYL